MNIFFIYIILQETMTVFGLKKKKEEVYSFIQK